MYYLLPFTMFDTLSHDVTATVLLLSKLYQTTPLLLLFLLLLLLYRYAVAIQIKLDWSDAIA